MTDERELLASLDRLEAASRRTRPWQLLGVLGILAGFAILVIRINEFRAQAVQRAITAERERDELKARAHQVEIGILAYQATVQRADKDKRAGRTPGPGDNVEAQWAATQFATDQLLRLAGRPTARDVWEAASIAASNPKLSVSTLKELFARGLGVNDVIDGEQNRAIHLASERCGDQVVSWLLSQGANPNIANYWHDTPLHIAEVRCGESSPTAIALQPRGQSRPGT